MLSVTCRIIAISVVLAFASPSGADNLGTAEGELTRSEREIRMAEQAILADLALGANPQSIYLCSEVELACLGPSPAELGLSLIAAHDTPDSIEALAQLVRLRSDAGLGTDFVCLVLEKASRIEGSLRKIDPVELAQQCTQELEKLISPHRESFTDVNTHAVCRTPDEMKLKIAELVEALESGRKCDPGDY